MHRTKRTAIIICAAGLLALRASPLFAANERTFLLISEAMGRDSRERTELVLRGEEIGGEFEEGSDASWDGLARGVLWPFEGVALEGEEGASRELVMSNGDLPPIVVEMSIERFGERTTPAGDCGVWGVALEGRRKLPDRDQAATEMSDIEITGAGRVLLCPDSQMPLAGEVSFSRRLVALPWSDSAGGEGRTELAWSEIP